MDNAPDNSSANPDSGADPGGVTPSRDTAPFRESGSGASYSPSGNWGAERQASTSPGEAAASVLGGVNGVGGTTAGETMAGAPTDAGDGGFGPEGGYSGSDTGQPGGQPGGESAGGVSGDEPGDHAHP